MAKLGTRDLILTIGGTDVSAEITNCRLTAGDSDADTVSFADARAGGNRLYKLAFTAIQDPSTGSVWDKVWTAAGTTVAFVLKPAGGASASATTPWFSGNAVIKEPDGDLLGGEANVSTTQRFTFDVEWDCTAKPTRAVA